MVDLFMYLLFEIISLQTLLNRDCHSLSNQFQTTNAMSIGLPYLKKQNSGQCMTAFYETKHMRYRILSHRNLTIKIGIATLQHVTASNALSCVPLFSNSPIVYYIQATNIIGVKTNIHSVIQNEGSTTHTNLRAKLLQPRSSVLQMNFSSSEDIYAYNV